MRVAVDISLYPLADDFILPIKDVIERLNAISSVEVLTNAMSTQIRGEYEEVISSPALPSPVARSSSPATSSPGRCSTRPTSRST